MRGWLPIVIAISLGTVSVAEDSVHRPSGGVALRVLPTGKVPNDARLGELTTLDKHFPFVVPENPAAWYARADELRRRVRVAVGLWPMPERTPIEATMFGKIRREGFTLQRVYFQSLPGHYVTGLLFRPNHPSLGRSPGVLSPHGHGGRNQRFTDDQIADQIARGGEHFENSGRIPKLARCATLARMGCVVFIFDMLGYEDSVQISHEVAHGHKDPRPAEQTGDSDSWAFYSPQADLRLQSIMGLQTWNAIRALDFLASLPDVDPDRLAVTGGSGGGTQSILLGAIDERVKVSFPNGMVSTAMQGGCYCENSNLLRIGTGNVELAALFAPRPQAMTAANDWTKDMMNDGYPQLKWLYAMIGNDDDVYCRPLLHFEHNYNYVTRATMYQWMNRHLKLGLDEPVVEQDFEPFTEAELTVWDESHPAPTNTGVPHEQQVCGWFETQARDHLGSLTPTDTETLHQFRETIGGAWRVIFDAPFPMTVTQEKIIQSNHHGIAIEKSLLRDSSRGAQLPLLTLRRQGESPDHVVIWTDGKGKRVALDTDGLPTPLLRSLLDHGAMVMLPDLLGQGEFNSSDRVLRKQRLVDDDRSYSAFTFGYNRTLIAERCADLLGVIVHATNQKPSRIRLLGTAGSAPWVAPAAAIAGETVQDVLVDTGGFRFADASHYSDLNFVPGAVKYGDLPTLLALRAPHAATILGESQWPRIVALSYAAAGASEKVKRETAKRVEQAVDAWLD